MNTGEVNIDTDLKCGTKLRRYMDLPKFLDLLHSQTLYLRRADGFVDRLEGALFPSHRNFIQRARGAGFKRDGADVFYQRGRTGNYVSCWAHGNRDSIPLWRLYGGVGPSVAIETTIEQLAIAALSWERGAVIHRVKYVEHAKVKTYVISAYTDMLQYKHLAYKYENEVRLIVPQQGDGWESNPIGLRLPVPDLSRFIRAVVVSPESSPEVVEVIKGVTSKYGLKSTVLLSNLAKVVV